MNQSLNSALIRNQGRLMLPDFLHTLSDLLQTNITEQDILDFNVSQQCIAQFYKHVEACSEQRVQCFQQQVKISDDFITTRWMNYLKEHTDNKKALLIRRESEYCGVVQVHSNIAISHSFSLVQGDDFQLASNVDAENGLLLSLDEEWTPEGYEDMYTLTVWGQKWLKGFIS